MRWKSHIQKKKVKKSSAVRLQQAAVPGAGLSPVASEGFSCGLTFTSANLYYITTSKHLPWLEFSCTKSECEGAARKTKVDYSCKEIHYPSRGLPLSRCCCWDLCDGFPAWGPLAGDVDDWSSISSLDSMRTGGNNTTYSLGKRAALLPPGPSEKNCWQNLHSFNKNETQMSIGRLTFSRRLLLMGAWCWKKSTFHEINTSNEWIYLQRRAENVSAL